MNVRVIDMVVLLLLGLLFYLILSKGKPREAVNIVRSDPPLRNPKDPDFVRRRARAGAAASVYHRKRHSTGELDENH